NVAKTNWGMNDTVMPADMNQIGQQINEGTANLDSHTSNTNNPHSVTKEQVGLGNVENFPVATQAEAEVGTATNRYMTPERTAQAISVLASGKRSATLIVAASNSSQASKDGADFVCTGTDDQNTINAAIAALPAGGGKVLLLEGLYTVSGPINLVSNMTLEGMGASSIIKLRDNHNPYTQIIYG